MDVAPGSHVKKPKLHRFHKKQFDHPTWCIFANSFIWGLDKSGYECSQCGMVVSRKHISEAKRTVCSSAYQENVVVGAATDLDSSKFFTVHLPHGAKKSMKLEAMEPLQNVLEKICIQRGLAMEDYVPRDMKGQVIPIATVLCKIEGGEITFTEKDNKGYTPEVIIAAPAGYGEDTATPATKSKIKNILSPRKPHNNRIIKGDNPAELKSQASIPEKSKGVPFEYDFGDELGNGAFSVVLSGTHKTTGEIVAIKVLEKYEDDTRQQKKLQSELEIIAKLDHPNIVKFFQFDEDEENFYVVMELVSGGELFDQIVTQRYYYEREAAPLICQVLQGVTYLHDRGVAHRDLKPENLLFKSGDQDIIKIADFGESKYLEKSLSTYCGTPDYMAPEIIRGMSYGLEVDMWAVGVIAFVMMGGYVPFDGENDSEVFASILGLKFYFQSPEWDHVGQDGRDFIRSLLKINPVDRLTARQALSHSFITKFTSESQRAIPPVPSPEATSAPEKVEEREKEKETKSGRPRSESGTKSTSSKVKNSSPPPEKLDLTKNPRQLVLDRIATLSRSLKDDPRSGEVKYMKAIVSATGTCTSKLEIAILEETWERLNVIQSPSTKLTSSITKKGK
eukprot:TRINITY_DN2911_c0_g1_i1.p1 TRINITY_DN2911_c0_g1~~TRINITY_DN2911_c0_g1_i1.p1  ORF type:complete len:620 (-),score=129.52 TRINITY_DN2911_c0_g1_i1:76-1935(-)